MAGVEVLNAWGLAWATFMLRSLVEATALFAMVLLVWLPLRRRMSSQLTYGLFLLVLVKAAVPIPVALPAALSRLTPRQAIERLVRRPRAGTPGPALHHEVTPRSSRAADDVSIDIRRGDYFYCPGLAGAYWYKRFVAFGLRRKPASEAPTAPGDIISTQVDYHEEL